MPETKHAFDSVADDYGDLYAEFYAGMKKIICEEVYLGDRIRKVLDLGGGGKPPQELFTNEIVDSLELFVSNDVSFSMLERNPLPCRVNSDGFAPPFMPGSFDTVLIYGCLHHIGHENYRDRFLRLKRFLREVSPLVHEDGYIYFEEPTLPWTFETIERFILFPLIRAILRRPAVLIYMYRSRQLERVLREEFNCEVLKYRKTSQVVGSPWKTSSPFLFFKWFRLPVAFIPYRYLLCRARPKRKSEGRLS